jgi:two-component system, sensor histidine kinase and response regulator
VKSYSILVIDDEPDNFEVIEALLPQPSYSLQYASSGATAIASLDTFSPDVILLDLMMPEMDGIEACRRIKSMNRWKNVPILMVTALSTKADLAKCLSEGADDFITKPIDSLELRARVSSAVRIKKQFDRIESLSKLQKQNIALLEHNLNEMSNDLARGFVSDLNQPVTDVLEQIESAISCLAPAPDSQIEKYLTQAYRSASDLDSAVHKILLYLDFSMEPQSRNVDEKCMTKAMVDQILALKSQWMDCPSEQIKCRVDDVSIGISDRDWQWIVTELLDNILKYLAPSQSIEIVGSVIDNMFRFSVSKFDPEYKIDRPSDDSKEIGFGMIIIKKIVEMCDGTFINSNIDPHKTTISITLPLG